MKKILFISLVAAPQLIFAQFKLTSVNPSVFYTYGDYDNNSLSNGITAFGTLEFNYKDYITFGYDAIKIENNSWNYNQKMGIVSITKNLFPFYANFIYSHLQGDFDYKPFIYKYSDYINIYSLNLTYNFGLNFVTAGGDYQNVNGFYNLVNRHYEIGYTRLVGTKLSLSIGITKSVISDGRDLTAVSLGWTYRAAKNVFLFANAMLGERAYYFSTLKLTYFNQNETQKGNISAGISYIFADKLKLSGSFTGSKFDEYSINYFAFGAGYFF
jgi:hypothetical protein